MVGLAHRERLTSDEHLTVDGTLIEAWASIKSFRLKDENPEDRPRDDDPGNPSVDFHGEKRSNATHQSTTDPEAKLCFSGHALMENRHGLLIDLLVEQATGIAEREAAIEMIESSLPGSRRITMGADKAYDTQDFVDGCRARNITPHIAAKKSGSTLDSRTTRHAGYAISQRLRKRVEEIFGWSKTIGGLRRTRYKERERTQLWAYMFGAAYDLLRMAKLIPPLHREKCVHRPERAVISSPIQL